MVIAVDRDDAGWDGLGEAVVFLKFEDLPDPRQRAKVLYPFDEILLLCLLAVLASAETITDMARFGDKKLGLLRRFRPFEDGTPTHDHLGDILAFVRIHKTLRVSPAMAADISDRLRSMEDVVPWWKRQTLSRGSGVPAARNARFRPHDGTHFAFCYFLRKNGLLGLLRKEGEENVSSSGGTERRESVS